MIEPCPRVRKFRKQIIKKDHWKVPVEIFTKDGNNEAMIENIEWFLQEMGLTNVKENTKERLSGAFEQTSFQGQLS